MSWEDRLREAAYTPPSGQRLTFLYEEASEQIDRKTSAYTFADADGTYVQDLGSAGRRYPLRLILSGRDYDTVAEGWMAALSETGEGVLEHPVHGLKTVIPTGTIKRRDDLVRQTNQAIIEVEFVATIGTAYPSNTVDAASAGSQAIAEAALAQAVALETADVFGSIAEQNDFLSQFNSAIDTVRDTLEPIASAVDEVQRKFNAIDQSISRGISVLIGDPLTLAFQFQELMRTPSRIADISTARIEAYVQLSRILIEGRTTSKPTLAAADLAASAAVIATIESANNTTFLRRPAAVQTAENLMILIDDVAEWRDQEFEALNEIDGGAAWQATQDAAAIVAGKLVGASFELPAERYLRLTSDRTIIDVAYELYGTVDDVLDDLINDNDLSGDQIIELPRGFEVVYYAN